MSGNRKTSSNFEDQQSGCSLSNHDLMQQLLCQETIPVSEEDNDSEHDEVFLRVKRENPGITNLLYLAKGGVSISGSDTTTRENSKKGSVLVPYCHSGVNFQAKSGDESIKPEMLKDVTNEATKGKSFFKSTDPSCSFSKTKVSELKTKALKS